MHEIRGNGILFIGDAHIAAYPPGHRKDGYREQILDKMRFALEKSAQLGVPAVFLGDLFHWPRENPNELLVDLIALFEEHKPWVLVGNHDKYQARYTRDVSMAVLEAAGVVRVISEPGAAFRLKTSQGDAVLGASPDATPIPASYDKSGDETVVWITHHNLAFPEFLDKPIKLREISGVDIVVNGHIHRPQKEIRVGSTTWLNPGNITRLTFSPRSLVRVPAAHLWRPGTRCLERIDLPYLPFYDVFPDQEFPKDDTPDEDAASGRNGFLEGLERLSLRRTRDASGIREFLQANLNPEKPETELIWKLYEETARV